jgi:hypothetical protein
VVEVELRLAGGDSGSTSVGDVMDAAFGRDTTRDTKSLRPRRLWRGTGLPQRARLPAAGRLTVQARRRMGLRSGAGV